MKYTIRLHNIAIVSNRKRFYEMSMDTGMPFPILIKEWGRIGQSEKEKEIYNFCIFGYGS